MRILLLNPPFKSEYGRFSREQRSPAITKGGTFYYPMWLCYAAGVLEQDGFEIKIIDGPASLLTSEEAEKRVAQFKPELVIVDTSTPSIYNDVQIAERIKILTGAYVVLVGTHPSALPEQTLLISDKVDAIARREYEYTLLELARKMRDSSGSVSEDELQMIDGLSFQCDGRIVHNPERKFINDLDELPFVSKIYHNHLNVRDYFYTIAQYPQVAIFSARGCPNRCVYCVYPQVMHGHTYRARSIKSLIDEFTFIQRELSEVREVFLEDDTFTVSRRRVQDFCEAYHRANLRISWIANGRADIDFETLKILKACNCRLLCVGFESGSQEILDTMKKNLVADSARQFVKNAKLAGILIHGCFMVGNPGESRETLEATLTYAKELAPDTAQFFPIMIYPGTDAYRWAKENDYLQTENYSEWLTEEGLHNCVVNRSGLSGAELVEFCDRARREFYLRPRYLLYRLGRLCCNPLQDGPRMWKSLRQFWKFLLRGSRVQNVRPKTLPFNSGRNET